MCLRFADMERKLGEVNRARALFAYCSQMCDPRTSGNFWETWKEFEIKHGNEDTLKEMLRVRRSVQATYNTQGNFMITQISAAQQLAEQRDEGSAMSKLEERASLQDRVEAAGGLRFVRSTLKEDQIATDTRTANVSQVSSNPNEINLDFDDEEQDELQQRVEGDQPSVAVVKKRVPDTVFGGVKHAGQSAEDDDADDLQVLDEEDAPLESANKSDNQRASPQKRKAQQPRAQKTFKKRRRNVDGRDNSHFSYD
jgi:pre-mRNA-splicing factor SYF1